MLTCVRRGCPVTHAAAGRKGGLTPSSWTWSWVESTLSQHISKQVQIEPPSVAGEPSKLILIMARTRMTGRGGRRGDLGPCKIPLCAALVP
ncbi:g10433 [Coccomyxa viridis]|uniref:G10433 protein n=1 Tax=Coccomyxa viridis TaxID=1274662 RepID=A0ABP1G812_9CHLO